MGFNVNRLLKKKGWTGLEVGQALVSSVIHDIKHSHEKSYKPLFAQQDFERMESSISTRGDYIAYSVYRELHQSILTLYNKANSYLQQMNHGYYRYWHTANACILASKEQDRAPLMLTSDQYQEIVERITDRKRSTLVSPQELLFSFLQAFLDEADKAPANIREILKELEALPADKEPVLAIYNEVCGCGFYALPDGRRGDSMTKEEWKEILENADLQSVPAEVTEKYSERKKKLEAAYRYRAQEKCRLFFMGADSIREAYTAATGKSLEGVSDAFILEAWERMLHDGYTPAEKEVEELQLILEKAFDRSAGATWHAYDAPPEINKKELLEDCLDYYAGNAVHYKPYRRYIDAKGGLREFKKDFPKLFAAMDAFIKEVLPALRDLKPSNYLKACISWGELADLDILDYKQKLETRRPEIIEEAIGEKESTRNLGIWAEDPWEENNKPILSRYTIESIAKNEMQLYELNACQENLIKPALRFIFAYNEMISILGAVFDIPEIEVAQVDTSLAEEQLETLNKLIQIQYAYEKGTPEQKACRRKLWREVFTPIYVDELKPDQAACETLAREITDLGISTKTCARCSVIQVDAMINNLANKGNA